MEEPVRSRPIIRVRKLRKVYRIGDEKVVALGNISLDVMQGQIVCIVGTSGSGKSTLLNQLAGLEKPTRGAVYIGKTNISALSENQLAVFRQHYLGFVFQSYNLLSTLTALENVALPMIFRGIGRLRRNKAALSMLAAVGLKRRAHHRPTQMSGGQQQRVGIARAFVTRPKVIFADEPTGNLDTKTTIAVMRMMVRFARKYKQTLIIVTHDPELSAYADRVVTLIDGAITSDVERVSICDSEGNILGDGEVEPPDPSELPLPDPLAGEVLPDDEPDGDEPAEEAENDAPKTADDETTDGDATTSDAAGGDEPAEEAENDAPETADGETTDGDATTSDTAGGDEPAEVAENDAPETADDETTDGDATTSDTAGGDEPAEEAESDAPETVDDETTDGDATTSDAAGGDEPAEEAKNDAPETADGETTDSDATTSDAAGGDEPNDETSSGDVTTNKESGNAPSGASGEAEPGDPKAGDTPRGGDQPTGQAPNESVKNKGDLTE